MAETKAREKRKLSFQIETLMEAIRLVDKVRLNILNYPSTLRDALLEARNKIEGVAKELLWFGYIDGDIKIVDAGKEVRKRG